MSKMTIQWDRGEQIGFMPQDSSVVYPEPKMTIEWEPLTTATIIDFDPADLLVSPGAGEDAAPGGGAAGGEAPGGAPHYGRPRVVMPHRRGEKAFLEHGLAVVIDSPAAAQVRAVLRGKLPRTRKRPARSLNLTKVLTEEIGAGEGRLHLRPSRAGRRLLHRLDAPVAAQLVLHVAYGNGQETIRIERGLTIVDG